MNPQKTWNSFLEEVLSSSQNHFLWLKSLSYLEYIGYRKMVKSLSYEEMGEDTFHHLSDEIQHSLLLGRIAGEQDVPHEIPTVAENYFQSLDSKIDEWVQGFSGSQNHRLSYLWTSYLIEKRAMKVYPSYFAKLISSPLKSTIQKIIKDEGEHLHYLETNIQQLSKKYLDNFSDLFVSEEKLFSKYLEEMKELME